MIDVRSHSAICHCVCCSLECRKNDCGSAYSYSTTINSRRPAYIRAAQRTIWVRWMGLSNTDHKSIGLRTGSSSILLDTPLFQFFFALKNKSACFTNFWKCFHFVYRFRYLYDVGCSTRSCNYGIRKGYNWSLLPRIAINRSSFSSWPPVKNIPQEQWSSIPFIILQWFIKKVSFLNHDKGVFCLLLVLRSTPHLLLPKTEHTTCL